MKGRTLFIGFAICLAAFAAALYYTINYAHYKHDTFNFISLTNDGAAMLTMSDIEQIDGKSSPIKYRVCGQLNSDKASLDSIFEVAENATPLVAPKWFKCFNAKTLTEELASGELLAYLYRSNEPYGVNTILAYNPSNGKGYLWRQLNECGDAQFSALNLPAGCPEFKE